MDRAGMLKVMHEVFGFVPVVMPWISAAGFLLLICLLCWRERGRAATAEIAKAQTMQTLASSTQTKEVNDIRAVFEESRLFTSARKERLIRDVNDFHQYLAQLGFDLPTVAGRKSRRALWMVCRRLSWNDLRGKNYLYSIRGYR